MGTGGVTDMHMRRGSSRAGGGALYSGQSWASQRLLLPPPSSPIVPDDWESQGWGGACQVAPAVMHLPGHGPARGLAFPSSAPRSCFSSFPVLSTPGKTLFAIVSQRAGCPCTNVHGFPASGTGSGRAEAPSEKLSSDSVSSCSALSRAAASGATGEGHHSVLLAVSQPPHSNAGPLWALFSAPWG